MYVHIQHALRLKYMHEGEDVHTYTEDACALRMHEHVLRIEGVTMNGSSMNRNEELRILVLD